MHHFFVDTAPSTRAVVGGEQARQIATVLRLQPGERIDAPDLVGLAPLLDRVVVGHSRAG